MWVPIPAISISHSNAFRSGVPSERDQWCGVRDGSIGLIGCLSVFAIFVKEMHAGRVAHFLATLAGLNEGPALTPLVASPVFSAASASSALSLRMDGPSRARR